jgi:porin
MNNVRYGLCFGATALACLASAAYNPVQAQAVPSASPFDPVISFGQTLAKAGVYIDLGYTFDFSAVANGGRGTGVEPIGHAFGGAVFDLQTIAGITGASIHVQFDERSGETINNLAGGADGLLQGDVGPSRPRLGWFYWEQGFDNDRLDITLGRTNPTFDFAFSNFSCSFVGVFCAQPSSWYFNNANTPYPSSTWGGRANFQVTPEVYVRAGVYQHSAQQGAFENAGFNWGLNTPGAFIPVEIGYQTSARTAQYPAKYNVGFYEDTASYTKATGGYGARNAVWAEFQQAVWRPDRSSPQILSAFGGALVYSGNSPQWGQYWLGLHDQAPFISRPRDTISFIASVYVNNALIHPNKSTEEQFELNYGFSAVPGVTVKPYTQYVIAPTNPGGSLFGDPQPGNAWVVGVQFVVDLAQAFEWPQFIPH